MSKLETITVEKLHHYNRIKDSAWDTISVLSCASTDIYRKRIAAYQDAVELILVHKGHCFPSLSICAKYGLKRPTF